MAGVRDEQKKYQKLRSEIERFVPELLVLLREVGRIWRLRLPEAERDAQSLSALQTFREKTKLQRIQDLQDLVSQIHTDYKRVENNSVTPGTWSHFVDPETNDITPFFTETNLSQPESLIYLYTYLNSVAIGVDEELVGLDKKAKAEEEAQKTGLAAGAAAIEAVQKTAAEVTQPSPEEKAQQIKEKQRESVERAKAAYVRHQKELERVNALLPQGRRLEKLDLDNLAKLASDSSFAPLDVEIFFNRYGLTDMVGRDNPTALAFLKTYFVELRNKNLQLRKTEGLSTNVFPSQEMQETVMVLSRQYTPRAVALAFSATDRQLEDKETTPDGKADADVAIARKIRAASLGTLWQPDRPAQRLIKGFIGRTKREQDQLLKDIGLVGADEVEIERPRLFEEFLGRAEDHSIVELLGVPADVEIPQFQAEEGIPPETEIPTPPQPPRQIDPGTSRRNLERLKTVAQTGKFIAANPAAIGLAVGGAGAVTWAAGLAAQAPGIMAVGGAITGGTIGFFAAGPLGAVVGAFVGGAGSYLAGQAAFGGPLISLPAGITAPSLGGVLGTAGAGIAPTASAGVSAGISGLSSAASTGIAGTQGFLSAMQALPSLMSGLPASTALVAGPLVITGGITIGIIFPAIFGSFLAPNTLTPGGTGRECVGASWPTDGTIGAIEAYAGGTTHATLGGRVVPNYSPYNIPVYGGQPLPPREGHELSGSGVDIANKQGIDVYSPYAGTAIAIQDPGSFRRADGSLGLGAYGNSVWVAVDDPIAGKFVLIFAHMVGFSKEIPVGKSFQLSANQFIGQIGSTGNSSAPHLHYEVVGIEAWKDIRSIVPDPNMKAGDKVSRDACETSESAPVDEFTDVLDVCNPVFNKTTIEPDTVSVSFASTGCDRLVNSANAYVNQLTQGFCGGYNQPRDTRLRSIIWNKSLFMEKNGQFDFSPGGDPRRYTDMAWCTSLVIEVYKANYFGPRSELFTAAQMGGVARMHGIWKEATGAAPVKASETPISEVPLGSAIFYMKGSAFSHVGLVCAKTDSTITSCEANGGVVHNEYQTSNGIVLPRYGIVAYGFPPASLLCEENVKKPNGSVCRLPEDCQSGLCDVSSAPAGNPDIGICQPRPIDQTQVAPNFGGAF